MASVPASAVLGPGLWDVSLLGLVSLRVVPTLFATGCGAFALYNIMQIIVQGGAGKNGSTVAVRERKKTHLNEQLRNPGRS